MQMPSPMLTEGHAFFARKIAAIHEAVPSIEPNWLGWGEVDLGRAETEAMIESFLGPAYPRSKVEQVVHAQSLFREWQLHSLRLFNLGEFGAAEYVDRVNRGSDIAMEFCHAALGDADFKALFGGPLAEVQRSVRIDLDTFVQQQRQLMAETSAFRVDGA